MSELASLVVWSELWAVTTQHDTTSRLSFFRLLSHTDNLNTAATYTSFA